MKALVTPKLLKEFQLSARPIELVFFHHAYRTKDGRFLTGRIGVCPAVKVASARNKVEKLAAEVELGENPQ